MLDAGLVAVIVDGTTIADGVARVNEDRLRGHRCAEGACDFTRCVLHDWKQEIRFGSVGSHIVCGIVFIGVDCDKGSILGCEFGVQPFQAHRVALCDGTFRCKEHEDDRSLFGERHLNCVYRR